MAIDYAWTTPTIVLQAIADGMSKPVSGTGGLDPRWTRIVGAFDSGAIQTAYTELARILRAKGISIGQMPAWDDGPTYAKNLSMFFAYVMGAGLSDFNDRDYNKLDCRKQLDEMTSFSIGGSIVEPAATLGGPVLGTRIQTFLDVPKPVATFYLKSDRRRQCWPYGLDYREFGCG